MGWGVVVVGDGGWNKIYTKSLKPTSYAWECWATTIGLPDPLIIHRVYQWNSIPNCPITNSIFSSRASDRRYSREIFLWICRADQGDGTLSPRVWVTNVESIWLPGNFCGDTERRLNPSFLLKPILRLNKWFVPTKKVNPQDRLYLWVSMVINLIFFLRGGGIKVINWNPDF